MAPTVVARERVGTWAGMTPKLQRMETRGTAEVPQATNEKQPVCVDNRY
jgi:hypothetical protein